MSPLQDFSPAVNKSGAALLENLLPLLWAVALCRLTGAVAGVQVVDHRWAVDLHVLRRRDDVTDVSSGF